MVTVSVCLSLVKWVDSVEEGISRPLTIVLTAESIAIAWFWISKTLAVVTMSITDIGPRTIDLASLSNSNCHNDS